MKQPLINLPEGTAGETVVWIVIIAIVVIALFILSQHNGGDRL